MSAELLLVVVTVAVSSSQLSYLSVLFFANHIPGTAEVPPYKLPVEQCRLPHIVLVKSLGTYIWEQQVMAVCGVVPVAALVPEAFPSNLDTVEDPLSCRLSRVDFLI